MTFNIGDFVILYNHEIAYDGYLCEIKNIKDNIYDILPLGEHYILTNIDKNKLIKLKNNNININFVDKKDETIYKIIKPEEPIQKENKMFTDFLETCEEMARNVDKNEIVIIKYEIDKRYMFNGFIQSIQSIMRYIEDNYNLKLNTLIKDGTYCTRYRTDRTLINQLIENNIYILCKESKICNTLDNCIDAIIFAYIKQTPKETYAERKERITKENNRFLREKEECATQ